jgi:serine/threonine-protein kinase RsbW
LLAQVTFRQEALSVLLPTLQQTLAPQRDSSAGPFGDVLIPSDPAEARCLQEQIERLLQDRRTNEQDIFSIKLALEEALINAIKHGNQMDRTKKVRVSYQLQHDRFDVFIADEGTGFDPTDVPDPTAIENLERPCGRGLMLMRHYMTEVDFGPRGNTVKMSKVLRNGKK